MPETFTLPNGLRVVHEYLPQLRSVNAGIYVRSGSVMESPEEGGISHFLEHMSFKGTSRRTTRQIAEETDQLGGGINAFTSRQATCYYGRVIDEDLPACFDLLSDLVMGADLPPDELERERGVILEEIAMAEDDTEDLCAELLTQAQYGGDLPMARPILGRPERVSAYTRSELLDYRRRRYTPGGCVVSLCGQFDPDAVRRLITEGMGRWSGPALDFVNPPAPILSGQRVAVRKETEQLQLGLGYPGCGGEHPDRHAMTVLASILGGAMSSRLFQRIREELGLAYSVYSVPVMEEGSGLFQIYAGVSPQNGRRVLEEIGRVVADLAEHGPTEKEFHDVQKQLRVGYLLGLESTSGRMLDNGRRVLSNRPLTDPAERLRQMEAVTREQVTDLARRVFGEKPCLSAVGPNAEDFGAED